MKDSFVHQDVSQYEFDGNVIEMVEESIIIVVHHVVSFFRSVWDWFTKKGQYAPTVEFVTAEETKSTPKPQKRRTRRRTPAKPKEAPKPIERDVWGQPSSYDHAGGFGTSTYDYCSMSELRAECRAREISYNGRHTTSQLIDKLKRYSEDTYNAAYNF